MVSAMVAGGFEAVHFVFLLCAQAARPAQVANRKTARRKDRRPPRHLMYLTSVARIADERAGICHCIERIFWVRRTASGILSRDEGIGYALAMEFSELSLSNCIFHANRSAGHDLGPQSAAMNQSSQDALLRQTFKVSAGFAEPRSTQAHGSDLELPTHKMIQRHASSDYVAPHSSGRNRNALFAFQRFDGLKFNQCHFAAHARSFGPVPCAIQVSIPFEAPSRDRFDFLLRFHRHRRIWRGI